VSHFKRIFLKFTEFNFDSGLLEGIEAANYIKTTPIQELVIPHILNGKDVMAFAQTGTGKTAAFLLPLINNVLTKKAGTGIKCMIIVPTRELAVQISQHLEGLSYFTPISSIAVYGGGDGNDFIQEKNALIKNAEFVVCTPGKMMAHIKMGYVNLDGLQYLVLDEADRMLDMGFYNDIMFIIGKLPQKRQTLLFSATMAPKIKTLAHKILHQPIEVSLSLSKPPEKIVQQAFMVYDEQKIPLIIHLLKEKQYRSVLIFCSSKLSVKNLTRDLKRKGIVAAEIHSDLEQAAREDILVGFKSGRIPVLVATDILSRGIDIDNIDLVINFDVPRDSEDYVHRIGRTARAAADGTAFTLVTLKEQHKFHFIEKLIGKDISKMAVPEHLGKQPAYSPARKNDSAKPSSKRNFKPKGKRHQ
jgi:ATP-dependent RNA helicase RhlE